MQCPAAVWSGQLDTSPLQRGWEEEGTHTPPTCHAAILQLTLESSDDQQHHGGGPSLCQLALLQYQLRFPLAVQLQKRAECHHIMNGTSVRQPVYLIRLGWVVICSQFVFLHAPNHTLCREESVFKMRYTHEHSVCTVLRTSA